MTTEAIRSRILAALTCGAAIAAVEAARFSRSVLERILGSVGSPEMNLSSLTAFALGMTTPPLLGVSLVACIAAILASELGFRREGPRLSVLAVVLLMVVLFLIVALVGFFISFHAPQPTPL